MAPFVQGANDVMCSQIKENIGGYFGECRLVDNSQQREKKKKKKRKRKKGLL